jgi:hypothetical protein
MRLIVLSAALALGLGIAGSTGASAAAIGTGINQAASAASLLEDVRVRCRSVRTCWRDRYGRRHCSIRRVCRRW